MLAAVFAVGLASCDSNEAVPPPPPPPPPVEEREPSVDRVELTLVDAADPEQRIILGADLAANGEALSTPTALTFVPGTTYVGRISLGRASADATADIEALAETHRFEYSLTPTGAATIALRDTESDYVDEDTNGGDFAVGFRFEIAVDADTAPGIGTLTVTLHHFAAGGKSGSAATSPEPDLRLRIPVAFAALPPPALVAPEVPYDPAYTGAQAERRTVDLYVPEGDGPFPLVLWAHGGGYTRVSPDKGYNVAEFLQAHGYAVALVGYRLAGPPDGFIADDAMEDYLAALAFVLREPGAYRINPDRIVLMGHSSGGSLATRAAINSTWLGSIGVEPERIALCVPIDQATGWNIERALPRSRGATAGSTEDIYGVTRDDRPEPGYAPVGVTANAQTYPTGTPLYDHPTILYPDLDGRRHPRNLSVLYDLSARTPPHWVPYSLRSADRAMATAEFAEAMRAADRPVATLELTGLSHSGMKAFIGRYDSAEAARLSDGLLEALREATQPATQPRRAASRTRSRSQAG